MRGRSILKLLFKFYSYCLLEGNNPSRRIKFVYIIFILTISSQTYSQKQWLYLHDGFQSGQVNPAYLSKNNWQISLGDFMINSAVNGAKFDNFIVKETTGYKINADEAINEIGDKAVLYASADINTLGLGKRFGNGYLMAGHSIKVTGDVGISKATATLFLKGNEPFIGKEEKFELTTQYQALHQIYVGYAHQVGRLKLGIKLKYLNGLATFNTNNSSLSLFTADNNYETIVKNNLVLHSTSPVTLDSNFTIKQPTINLTKNYGYGLDLGLEFQIDEHASIMVSATDLGKITWNDNANVYTNNKETIVRGLNVKDVIDGKDVSLEDTLSSIFQLSPIVGGFNSTLSSMINLGGKYKIDKYTIGAMVTNQYYSYSNQTNLSLMAMSEFNKIINLGLSYTYRDAGHYAGLKLGLNLGPVKLVLASQNVLQATGLKSLQTLHGMAGMSIEFGKIKINKDEEY